MSINNILVTVIGAGSYGTALAIVLARNGNKVLLWGHNPHHIKTLEETRCNQKFLPNIPFPSKLYLEASLKKAVVDSNIILIVVPSYIFKQVLMQIKPYLNSNIRIVWGTKGLESKTGRLLQDVVREVLGDQIPLAVLSGPTFAKELASGLPTAIVLAATDDAFSNDLKSLLHCSKNFRVYKNYDFIGIQLGGVIKNVIAIGAGISDGIGFGANARTALITRGLMEMARLGKAMGAQVSTFMGIAGLGDLVLTCTDNQSRNRRFGILLGQGKSIKDAHNIIGQVVEGFCNTQEVLLLAHRYSVEMPITEQIYEVLYQNKNAYQAALTLLSRAQKIEEIIDLKI